LLAAAAAATAIAAAAAAAALAAVVPDPWPAMQQSTIPLRCWLLRLLLPSLLLLLFGLGLWIGSGDYLLHHGSPDARKLAVPSRRSCHGPWAGQFFRSMICLYRPPSGPSFVVAELDAHCLLLLLFVAAPFDCFCTQEAQNAKKQIEKSCIL